MGCRDPEPVPRDSPLLTMDNVVLSSHVASASERAVRQLRAMNLRPGDQDVVAQLERPRRRRGPLVAYLYSIEQAKHSGLFDLVAVSSDSVEFESLRLSHALTFSGAAVSVPKAKRAGTPAWRSVCTRSAA